MKLHMRALASVVAVLALCKVFVPDVSAEPATITQVEAQATTKHTAMDYLQVQDDGTVAIKHDAVGRIPLDQREQAITSLDALNDQINEGIVAPFTVNDNRLKTTIISDSGVEALGNCFCGGCCSQHMCCKNGWWLFCWGYGSC